MSWRLGIVGLGKIARDKHLPAIAADPAFTLVAVADPGGAAPAGVAAFASHQAMLAAFPDLDAVAVCTPPGPRHGVARDCLLAGKQVLLEKPPAATLSELVDLDRLAAAHGRVLYATWHSRHAPAVEAARRRLAGQQVRGLRIVWKEDVRRWHPGQQWIWQPGGFGVFDPGINALSIATRILPVPLFVRRAELYVPANRDTPIAADLDLGAGFEARFDWRQTGEQIWEIEVDTDDFALKLGKGGGRLEVDGALVLDQARAEYAAIYRRFDDLLRSGASDVDGDPLRLVADAFLIGRRTLVDPFED